MPAAYVPGPNGPMVVAAGSVATTTFDPSNTSADVTLSNGNLTLTTNTIPRTPCTRSIAHHGSGIYYTEVAVTTAANAYDICIGVCNSSFPTTGGSIHLGTDANSAGIWVGDQVIYGNGNSNLRSTGITYAAGDRIGVEIDKTNQTMRIRKNGGAYSLTASLSFITGDYYFVIESFNSTSTTNFGGSAYTDTPTGSNW